MPPTPRHPSQGEFVRTARLLADPTRAAMLLALTDGEERSAGDLAALAGVSAQTSSAHLAKMTEGRLVMARAAGRVHYYRLAGPKVEAALEALAEIAPTGGTAGRPRPEDPGKEARTCYDHLAGRLGVNLTDALLRKRIIAKQPNGYSLTVRGAPVLRSFGLDLPAVRARFRSYALPCPDRTERRPHLAGSLGAALATRLLELGWIQRQSGTRAVRVTPAGRRGLRSEFGVEA